MVMPVSGEGDLDTDCCTMSCGGFVETTVIVAGGGEAGCVTTAPKVVAAITL